MRDRTADAYRRFADLEARGVSATYFAWASAIADDDAVLHRIAALPAPKRQPNLVFAAARLLGAPTGAYDGFRTWLLAHWPSVERVVATHATQTNEAGRCAVLLPVLSRLDGPLALIEAGASAGLCLYPDRYSYRYDVDGQMVALDPADGPSSVVLPCRIDPHDVPSHLPEVVWRAGVDLNPLDLRDREDLGWLTALIWPEHDERRARLAAAAAMVETDPPSILAGDLLETIPDLIASAPHGAHVVVFHSAVLVYLDAEHRERFAAMMRRFPGVTWISNEGERVLDRVRARLSTPALGRTVLAVNETPVALVGPHGQRYEGLHG